MWGGITGGPKCLPLVTGVNDMSKCNCVMGERARCVGGGRNTFFLSYFFLSVCVCMCVCA